jgi:aminoglycoside/choline kinase family phosphotransferase
LQTSETTYQELESLFKSYFKHDVTSREPLSSHGSDRIIIRLRSSDGRSTVGIINNHIEENNAFIGFTGHFRNHKLNVPEIYGVSEDRRSYIMEDLGNATLLKRISDKFEKEEINLYEQALSELLKFQITAGKTVDFNLCYQFDEFGGENIDYDLKYFTDRFLKVFYKEELDLEKLSRDLELIKNTILELPREYFLYRDFQSRNIMIKNEKLYFIDYQSGRRGALQYDVASLLYDAKADLPQEIRGQLIDYYVKEAAKYVRINKKDFEHYLRFFALVRILQAMGAYGYLGIVKGKKQFLDSIPYALNNINFILGTQIQSGKLEYLRNIFTQVDLLRP